MDFSAIFPALAFVLGIFVSAYLFIEWLRHSRQPWFLFYWASALFLMYWFQVPIILNKLEIPVVQSDFNSFFAISFPVTFAALIFILLGSFDVIGLRLKRKTEILFFAWLLFALAFFIQQFIGQEGVMRQYLFPLVGSIAFYLPVRLLIIFVLARWLWQATDKTIYGILGANAIIGESILGIIRNVLIIKSILAYPPQFWYVVLSGLDVFFILQTASIVLLAAGFFFFHFRQFHDHIRQN